MLNKCRTMVVMEVGYFLFLEALHAVSRRVTLHVR